MNYKVVMYIHTMPLLLKERVQACWETRRSTEHVLPVRTESPICSQLFSKHNKEVNDSSGTMVQVISHACLHNHATMVLCNSAVKYHQMVAPRPSLEENERTPLSRSGNVCLRDCA